MHIPENPGLGPSVYPAMIDSARPRTRRVHSKVKTGCGTCKIRRIKCDEAKPYCLRCTSTGRKCDGYVEQLEKPSRPDASALSLVRQFPTAQKHPLELRAVDFFQHRAAPRISSFFENDTFWQRVVLQLGQSNVAVRHAIIAVSTVYEQAERGQGEPVRYNDSLALQSYNKAIQRLFENEYTPDWQAKVSLIVCALFVCIEFMRGEISAAQSHIRSGLKILEDWQILSQQSSLQSSPQSSSQSSPQPSHASSSGSSTYSEQGLVGELESLFSRLRLQSDLFDPPNVLPVITDDDDENGPNAILTDFYCMADARNWNFKLSNMAYGLILSTFVAKYTASVTIDQLVLHVRLMAQFQQWQVCFEQFMTTHKHAWTRQEANAANVLYAQHLSMYIWMAPCLSPEESAFDSHRPEFEKIVQLASETISDGHGCENLCHSAGNFQFDMGLIPPLHLAGSKCRWPDLRREILRILGSAHWREGMFDSYRSFRYVYEIMLVEEAAIDGLSHEDALLGNLDGGAAGLPSEAARVHRAELGPLEPGASWQRLTLVSKPDGVLAMPVSWVTFISTTGVLPLVTPFF